MIDVGDLHNFARNYGRWVYKLNPKLNAEQLKAMIQQFIQTTPIDVGENWSMSEGEFIEEAIRGYGPEEEPGENAFE